MRRMSLLLLLIMAPLSVCAQDGPAWITDEGREQRYPNDRYLTGFGFSTDADRGTCSERAWDQAQSQLVQRVRVTIQTESTSKVEETEDTFSSSFSRVVEASSKLEIQRLERKDHHDGMRNACYALAYVERARLVEAYRQKASTLKSRINSHRAAARRNEEAGQSTEALNEYLACFPLFRQLEEAWSVIVGAQLEPDWSALSKTWQQDEDTLSQVREAVQRLVQRPMDEPKDLAGYLAYTLTEQVEAPGQAVLVQPFRYQNTQMSSPFASYLREELEGKFFEVGWGGVHPPGGNVAPNSSHIVLDLAQAAGATHVLSGTYWEQAYGVRFLCTLRRVTDGRIVASTEATVPASMLAATGLRLKPANFGQALRDQKTFQTGEVAASGGLHLEAWTNREATGNIFKKDDIMRVYVRVNRPTYIRFVYHLADGARTLLMDSEYIGEEHVNQPYQISDSFYAAAPYGAETLQIFASTRPFDPVETVRVDGYDVLSEDLATFLVKMRGMKRVVAQAEKRLVITTMPR